MAQLKSAPVPVWMVPDKQINRPLELHAAMGLPYTVGGLDVPPLSAGTLSLLEVAGCAAYLNTDLTDILGIMRMLFICCERDKAAPLVYAWRRCFESENFTEADFDRPETYHALDRAAFDFCNLAGVMPDKPAYLEVVGLFEYFAVSFNGFDMLQPKGGKSKNPWLYDCWSLASLLQQIKRAAGVTGFDAMWRYPLALASMMIASYAQSEGEEYVCRPPKNICIDNLRFNTMKREIDGQLHPWQVFDPIEYDLSEYQVRNQQLAAKWLDLRAKCKNMTPDEYRQYKADHLHAVKEEIAICNVPHHIYKSSEKEEMMNHG